VNSIEWAPTVTGCPAIRELRAPVRDRAKFVQLRSGLKAQVHAVMAKGCKTWRDNDDRTVDDVVHRAKRRTSVRD
jgi:hypothetical protein